MEEATLTKCKEVSIPTKTPKQPNHKQCAVILQGGAHLT